MIEVPVSDSDTTESLFEKLFEPSLELSRRAVITLCSDKEVDLVEQDHSLATKAPTIKTIDGALDFSQPIISLERLIRAFGNKPGTFVYWHNSFDESSNGRERIVRIRILEIENAFDFLENSTSKPEYSAGSIVKADPKLGLFVRCGEQTARIVSLRPDGKKTMSGSEFVRGYNPQVGDRFLQYSSLDSR